MSNIPTLRLPEVAQRIARFQISFRPCKGSEYVFEGKHIKNGIFGRFIIGGPASRQVPRELLKRLLRRFGIDVSDFLNDSFH